MKTVSFIGLGTMGYPMARNLLKKGFSLTVYNRTKDKAYDLVDLGAEQAETPAEATRASDVVFTMLGNDAAVQEVYYGQAGIVEGLRPGVTIVDCSTISPELSRRLHHDLQTQYVSFLDAPVTGSKPAAEAGSLHFIVGGSLEVMDELKDIFAAMGKHATHMGPSGSGSEAKLANNMIAGINMAAFCEGMALAAKAGLNLEKFAEVVLNGGAGSKMAELKAERILDGQFSVQFGLGLMLKDMKLATDFASSQGVPAPLLEAARSQYQVASSKGWDGEDLAAVLKCYEDWTGTPVRRSEGKSKAASPVTDRRRANRIPLNISLRLSVYQWEQEGSFSGQTIEGTLVDLSESGLLISSAFPLAQDMFIVIHFPQEAKLPPITGKIVRIETRDDIFRYGCMLSGLPPYTRKNLENYIQEHEKQLEK